MSLRAPRLRLAVLVPLAAAALAAAVAAELTGGPEMPERLGDLAAGLALLGGGAVASLRRPGAGAGPLMVASGVAWFAGDLWSTLLYAHRGPLVHLMLTYPSGRTSSRVTLLVISAAYVDGVIPEVARSEWATLALALGVVLVAAERHRVAGVAERRARASALAAAVLLCATLALTALGRLLHADTAAAPVWALYGSIIAIACGLTADLLWGRWGRSALTGFVIDLGDRDEPQALQGALARALGDPGLELAYRVDDGAGWVDEAGRPVLLPARDDEQQRAVTPIGDEGAPLAALVHDPATLADSELIAAVAAATRLAVANVRLQAEIAARLDDMAASRRRLVEAGDEERRRLRDQLGAGPEARLDDVAARLERLAAGSSGEAEAALRRLIDEVGTSRAQLRDLAHGIRPRTLTAGGLRPALDELARQSSVPVHVEAPHGRFPPALELAAYFVCSESLANVAKHADASRVRVVVARSEQRLRILVDDDGIGGAEARNGAGLSGLADRVEALAGRLRVDSPHGGGTRVEASLPMTGSVAR
jgi:signal transduction histidine kinase